MDFIWRNQVDLCDALVTWSPHHFHFMDPLKNVKHTRIGVWDLYEDISATPISSRLRWPGFKSYTILARSVPYVWRMIKDIASTPDCSFLLLAFLLLELVISFIPAVSLYYSGQLLTIVCFVGLNLLPHFSS